MLDHTGRPGPTRKHEVDHTDLPSEISRPSSGDRSSARDLSEMWTICSMSFNVGHSQTCPETTTTLTRETK